MFSLKIQSAQPHRALQSVLIAALILLIGSTILAPIQIAGATANALNANAAEAVLCRDTDSLLMALSRLPQSSAQTQPDSDSADPPVARYCRTDDGLIQQSACLEITVAPLPRYSDQSVRANPSVQEPVFVPRDRDGSLLISMDHHLPPRDQHEIGGGCITTPEFPPPRFS